MDRQTAQKVKSAAARGAGAPSPIPPSLAMAARLAVGLLLVISGTMKAAAPPEEFSVILENYQILSSADALLTIATFLPWLEVVLGFCFLFGFLTRAAAAAAVVMFVTFIGALLTTIGRGIHLPNCGCFGFGWHPSPGQTIFMDSLLTVCAVLAFLKGRAILSLDNWCSTGYTEGHTEAKNG